MHMGSFMETDYTVLGASQARCVPQPSDIGQQLRLHQVTCQSVFLVSVHATRSKGYIGGWYRLPY